nr:ubiquitin carboxyl-terminal hydrolase 12-like isoform X2 [Ipomoea batatas]GMC93846.1 ubiquitin carboxyl-terminal hydrolase 12-like isoform X2 [Ipomoea batatas]GMC97800.1 ubiquitin carboxyl-terminal hydrolase 12-like isoform X2 [Ipomoea batatas]
MTKFIASGFRNRCLLTFSRKRLPKSLVYLYSFSGFGYGQTDKSKEEILLFFKLYDPEKEQLRLCWSAFCEEYW